MSKLPFRSINTGVNVAEHSRRNYDDDRNSYNNRNFYYNSSRYRQTQNKIKVPEGNIKNIIPIIILFAVIIILYNVFK
jgi:hypothetical protein